VVNTWPPIHIPPLSLTPPYHEHPGYVDREQRFTAIRDALEGVELGVYDRVIVNWLAGWDVATVATVCSWLHRARQTTPETGDTR
jgi:hypothetical protein